MEAIRSSKSSYSVRDLTVVCIFLVFVFLIFLFTPKDPVSSQSSSPPELVEVGKNDLDAVLEKAALAAENNKTVIIAVVNKAYTEAEGDDRANMLDLFLESFRLGEQTWPLINNLLIVATDRTAYERCLLRGLHCYSLADETDGSYLAGEKVFMSVGFVNMMWRRTFFLLTVLRKGYNFIFTDADVMWLRNPFKRLGSTPTKDIQFSTDRFNGNPRSERNKFNTGFYFVRSNDKTISLFERWYNTKDNFTMWNDQSVLRTLIYRAALKELNVTASFLETRYFSGFCQDSKDFDKVVTVHANCCRFISAKLKDLIRVLEDWKRYRGMSRNEASSLVWSRHTHCRRSLRGMNATF